MISQRMRPIAATLVFTSYLFAASTICAAAEKTITDASGRAVKFSDTSRILSIGGDITEILYALKADGKIIAVDSTSLFPAEALQQKPNVGYLRALSAEGVLSTNPTLIIAAKDAGPPPVVAVLKASAIPYLEVPDDQTPEGVAAKIRFVAAAVGEEAAGEVLAKNVEKDFALLAEQRAKIAKPVRAIFVLTVLNGRATVAGSNTSADAMLRLAGAENAVAKVTGFKPLADEAGVELAPDAIVAMKHGRMGPPSEAISTVNALRASPAMQQNRIIEMNSLYLLGFGPRCASAARDLMKALYPELKLTAAGEVK